MKAKRLIAALLCFLLIGSMFPANAFAAGGVTGRYTLTLDENWEGGTGQVIPNITSYELPSAARPGEIFYGWALSPDGTAKYDAGDTVTLTHDLTLYAVWTFTQTFSISVKSEIGGTAFCDIHYAAAGETVTLTAIPDANYVSGGWFVSAPHGLIIRDNKFIMPDSDVTVKALFFDSPVLSPYRVHIRPEEGSGTVFTITNETTLTWQQYQAGTYDETKGTFFKNESGELFYEFPKQCPFTAPEGKVFDCWQASTTKDNLGSYSGGYIVDLNVFPQDYTGGITIRLTALWKDAEQSAAYSITVESSNGGTATADKAAYEKGETVTLTATPAAGYHFKEWQSSDVAITDNSFTMPEKDVTVKAVFEADAPTTYTGTGWYLDADGVLHITGDISESGFNLTSEQRLQVKSVVAESGASISSGEFLFNGFENMTSADLRLLNTTGVTNMGYMFSRCSSLTSLNLSSFDTSSVTTMGYMFFGCSSLTFLNLSSFDTSSVTTMEGMFSGCSSLTSLDVSGFSTSNVTSMIGMFTNCSSLTSIDLSSFDTGSMTSMACMFLGCSSLTSIDLSKFETGNVTSMGGMFYNCSGLTSLDLSSFDTSSVNNMSNMFSGCSSLTSLDVSGFKTDRLMYADDMFLDCSSLTSLGIRPDILYKNADDIIAIRSPWQKQGSTDTYSTADELKAVTDIVTLLAVYTVNVQNDGNGTASANPAAAVKGETVTLTATPNTGYHFKEWQSSDVTVNNNSFTMPAKAVTVTAVFEAIPTYTVTFDMNGHGTQITAQSVESGSKATKPADPTASGWTFGGWYADATFSARFDFDTAITSNTTAYAKWTKNSAAPADPTSPQTGDTSDMFLWIALLLVSGGALVGTTVYSRKKKYNAK